MGRLKEGWRRPGETTGGVAAQALEAVLTPPQRDALDPFDAVQLEYVVRVCRESKTLSEAGRRLFAVSRQTKVKANDADRLKKYLARFDLSWEKVAG